MLTRKSFGIFFISLFIISLSCLRAFAHAEVNISSVIYPPIISKQVIPGLGYGILRDITTESFKAVAVKVNYDLLPMARNVWSVVQEQDSICLGSIEWFKEQEKDVIVDHVEIINLTFKAFYKKSRFPHRITFDSLDELRKYTFGNVRGSSSQQTFDNAKIKTDLVRNIQLNFKKLNLGRFDFAISLDVTGNYLIRKLFPNRVSEFAKIEKPLLKATLSLIILKEQSRLKEHFMEGLSIIAKNGTYYNILKKYYGEDEIPKGTIPKSILHLMKENKR
ncbi:substrate-binding periplasmic protein [Maridesulfovibrio frigidus]|uniref:substrate-binding periplasmic protein n=1 Tax=Maridesulfovibrio frigidus TaxID=340956 RepID=UPI0004E1263F|nr:transporter substrate-binding domain-containing protein [Maridesulfovibrio frigidus]